MASVDTRSTTRERGATVCRARALVVLMTCVLISAVVRAADATTPAGEAPVITDLVWTPNPDPAVPLVLFATFSTDGPVRAHFLLDDGERPSTIVPDEALRTEHDVAVLGAGPDARYAVTLTVEDADGRTTSAPPYAWTTAPLPADFPPLHVTVSRPARMEPGVTLIPAVRWEGTGGPQRERGALVALDARGDVVWFYDAPHAITEAKRLANGHLLYYHGTRGHIVEMDMTGRVVRQWYTTRLPGSEPPDADAIPVDASTIHHDVQMLPSGNLLALSTERRPFELYPQSEVDPTVPRGPASVIGDVIVEFHPDGTVVNRWKVLDILDPYRIGYESLDTGFWNGVYAPFDEEPIVDWSHTNSLFYDEQDHALIASCYHLDTVFKLDLATGELVWMLTFPSGWDQPWQPFILTPVGEGLYPFHQHAARLTPQRTLLMFDNGKFRARPYQAKMPPEESFSRAVEYAIDEDAMEFREVWSYGGRIGERFFTAFLGETDWLPVTGNVLITDGGCIRRPDGSSGVHPNQGQKWARILEVTHEMPADVVFEVLLDDPSWGWTVYRSERLPSLYPARGATP